MKILMVLSTKIYPPDGRVEREARDLLAAGHEVFLMARRGPRQARCEIVEGVHVLRVPLPFQKHKGLADLCYFLLQRYLIVFWIIAACRRHHIQALHVHDLPYAFATTLAGRLLRIPVVFDMHEHYVAMLRMGFETRAYRRLRPVAGVLLRLLEWEERRACRWASVVIVVADEHIPRIQALGVPAANIVVVTNTEDIDYFSGLADAPELVAPYNGDFVILYVGGFSAHRGLETAIDALPFVRAAIPAARLLLVGDGATRPELEERVQARGVGAHVTFTGFQPFRTLPTFIRRSDVGLIPHISTPHVDTTMPNKIFQFMMLGRPVVVSSVPPMVRVVEDAGCGRVFRERDPESLARALIELADPQLRTQLGENGAAAVRDRYNWQQTVQALLRLYRDRLAVRAGGG